MVNWTEALPEWSTTYHQARAAAALLYEGGSNGRRSSCRRIRIHYSHVDTEQGLIPPLKT